MAFWQALCLTHALREISEHSFVKALGKGTSSTLDTLARDSALQGGGFYSLDRGLLSLTYQIIHPGHLLSH